MSQLTEENSLKMVYLKTQLNAMFGKFDYKFSDVSRCLKKD